MAATRTDLRLQLSVYNDAASFPKDSPTQGAGVGLANLRTRLQILHGAASELRMTRVASDGVEVIVTLPLREA
jgi:two-component system, LytTR family, sensor kinase